jgi:3-mercaptopyruvate sulfurtransferase SseA
MSTYTSPESLVETSWLAEHLNDPSVRVVESNEDILLYGTGHIPNAVHIDWRADLNDPVQRDYIAPDAFAKLAARNGISPDTTVVFYGDKANWWSAYALWVFRLFGHDKVKLLNGGRSKWEAEGRAYTREVPKFPSANYSVPAERLDAKIRAFKDETIVYCRIGERSSHTWFVLTYLLGFPHVKNYDGSWTEWGNSVRFGRTKAKGSQSSSISVRVRKSFWPRTRRSFRRSGL